MIAAALAEPPPGGRNPYRADEAPGPAPAPESSSARAAAEMDAFFGYKG